MSVDKIVYKSPEKVAQETAAVSEFLGEPLAEQLFYGETLPDYDPADPGDFRARRTYAARALSSIMHGRPDSFDRDEAGRFLGAMNSLQQYVAQAEADPSSTILKPGQIRQMREFADFFEYDAARRQGGYLVSPTGSGKTVLYTELVHATKLRTLVVVPTKELVAQTLEEFRQNAGYRHLDIGTVWSGEKREGRNVTIVTYASLNRAVKSTDAKAHIDPRKYGMVVYDEGHLVLGQEYRKAIEQFRHAIQIDVTATDEYNEAKKVGHVLPVEISRLDMIEAQNEQLVAPHRSIIVKTHTDMRRVKVASTGDYADDELYRTINTDQRNGVVVDTYEGLFNGKKSIAFCANIEHAKHMADMFRERGFAAEAIHSKMSDADRDAVLKRLKSGDIKIICNVDVGALGLNLKDLEVALMVRPTLSSLRLKQSVGRVMRIWEDMPDKVGYVVHFEDTNYVQPPVLYAEPTAVGMAQHAWEGFEFPEHDTSQFKAEADLIIDAAAIQAIADERGNKRRHGYRQPPEGWKNIDDVAAQFDCSKAVIERSIRRLHSFLWDEQLRLKRKGKPVDDLLQIGSNSGTYLKKGVDAQLRKYLSPDLIEALTAFIDSKEYEEAPQFWRNNDQLAALYGRTPNWVSYTFSHHSFRVKLQELKDEWGEYASGNSNGGKKLYFSPRFIQARVADMRAKGKRDIEDYSTAPPLSWRREEEAVKLLPDRAYDVALQRIADWGWNSVNAGRLAFPGGATGEQYFCSPDFLTTLQNVLSPSIIHERYGKGRLWSLPQLAEDLSELEVTEDDLYIVLQKTLQKDPGQIHYCGEYLEPVRGLVWYCGERLAAHIREEAIKRKHAGIVDEERLLDILTEQEQRRAEAARVARKQPDEPPATVPDTRTTQHEESAPRPLPRVRPTPPTKTPQRPAPQTAPSPGSRQATQATRPATPPERPARPRVAVPAKRVASTPERTPTRTRDPHPKPAPSTQPEKIQEISTKLAALTLKHAELKARLAQKR
jgi:superfamily II DNA or RNA helicase